MRFSPMRGCRRSVREQRYVFALLENWDALSAERKMELRGLVDAVTIDATEARALWEVLRGRSVESTARRTYVTERRIYELKSRFYERVAIR